MDCNDWCIWKILTVTFAAIIIFLTVLLSYSLYTIFKLRLYQIAIKNIPNNNFSNVVVNHSNVEKIEENGIIYKDYSC